ncbi:ArsB/NhaD family transporter [Fusibacter tunisiensis]|uniref:Na+/H+ antiporter NhaD/arsenite permease-like protein n=1 Tax=Fusibacter tunisiensis TaxID=1008308 RepID=A0ABS2MTK5_9FIRM|nr:ArsB/NhaD family transporter [Fusibacter tunisiensis]MBM7562781.1 Na+/H+ antiporter NhaD/arsenite permease-like protein [Fusibacter tunisiensis]
MFGNTQLIVAIAIFTLTYVIIVSEKVNRTAIAIFGAVLMLIFNIEMQEEAIMHVDFNTIGLLVGMMIIVNILKRTGIFEYVAIKAAKAAKGDPWKIVLIFSILTGVSSAFLDNVTTILLVVPVTIVIANALKLNPIPFLVPEVLIANIGGTATLIGDPPNIMIGSATGLGFNDFIVNLGPVVIVITGITMVILKMVYGKTLVADELNKRQILSMNEQLAIKDKTLLIKSLIVLGITIIGFMSHQSLGYESATIALFGAGLLLLLSKLDPEDILMEIEWPTIFFFMALFILVGALEDVGVIHFLAEKMLDLTHGDLFFTAMLILWVSAIASAFLDNIPFVATMIPLITSIGDLSSISITPLWWALALGACLGGNGTLVGASANVIVSGMLEKQGYKLSFVEYMKIGFPIMLVSVAVSTVYLWVRYL